MKEFTIKTKFDVGQDIVAFNRDTYKLEDFHIHNINFTISEKGLSIYYFNEKGMCAAEESCFASKQHFIENL